MNRFNQRQSRLSRALPLLIALGVGAPLLGSDTVEVETPTGALELDRDNSHPDTLKRLIVGDFDLARGALEFDAPVTGAEDLLETLRKDLETQLVKARKFTVLTREDLGSIVKRRELIDGKRSGPQEEVKLRNQYSGDFLVSGSLDRLYVHTHNRTIKRTGYVVTTKNADVALTMTVYNVGSGKIEWTEEYTRSYSWDKEALERDPDFTHDDTVARAMVLEAADTLTRLFISHSFPPRVVKLKADVPGGPVFVLNTNSSVHAAGEVLELVGLGEEIRDPDTGMSLGKDETFIGLIRITRQDDRKSEAVFVRPTEELRDWAGSKTLDPGSLVCRSPLQR